MNKISNLPAITGIDHTLPLDGCPLPGGKARVNILALGDVGITMLIGLRLLGADVIESIGICDLNKENCDRLEIEMNQIRYPFPYENPGAGQDLPPVEVITEDKLFLGDIVIFCASKGVPQIGFRGDVRMAQLEANRGIIRHFGKLAHNADFKGLMCIVSDPVDPLCAAFLDASGCKPWQVQGYGLGVMNARACYYAERDERFARYLKDGRAFGPHGQDLVIADSLTDYNDDISKELTELTVAANTKVRELGFKPYFAPALSSAALSVLLTLRGEWHYGSVYLGDEFYGAYFGVRNRITEKGIEFEDPDLPDALYERIITAYRHLCALRGGKTCC